MGEKGKLIVIEGPDGTGKKTHTQLLFKRLVNEGIPVRTVSFPDYNSETGQKVLDYLHGKLGPLAEVDPCVAAKLYQDDRLRLKPILEKWLEEGYNVLIDRYTQSNDAHQGGKFKGEERENFLKWSHDQEYNVNGLPKPDHVIYLRLPIDITVQSIGERRGEDNGPNDEMKERRKKDIHEASFQHMEDAAEVYELLAGRNPDWTIISCSEDGKRLSAEEIHIMIWETAKPLFSITKGSVSTEVA